MRFSKSEQASASQAAISLGAGGSGVVYLADDTLLAWTLLM